MTRLVPLAALIGAAALASLPAVDPDPAPKRIAWTTSRVVGRPDPAPPFRTRKAFEKVAIRNPVSAHAEPGGNRLLVVELNGRVLALNHDPATATADEFLRVSGIDFYSLTFHPDFAKNGYVYVFTHDNRPKVKVNRVLRFEASPSAADRPRRCDPKTESPVIEWPSNGHNGGDLGFGRDGMLYITAGDGTSDSDGDVTGQKLSDLNSAIIRIDVDHPDQGKGYSVPADNPFLKTPNARPELWAFGLRNPWRMTFDRRTGDLWVGDVGQDTVEMIQLIRKGGNYGWSVFEGSKPFYPNRERGPGEILKPVIEHPHSESRSITGGIVYDGKKFDDLKGVYLYGDYSTGKIWGMKYAGGKVTWQKELASTRLQIVGFAQDQAGNVVIVDHAGAIHHLEVAPPAADSPPFPRKLSDTGLFASTADHKPHPALIPYDVNSPLWSDGAAKDRFIALPGLGQIDFHESAFWGFPEGTVLVKTFTVEPRRRIETRLLTLQQGEWVGYSYRWNDEQTDDDLVPAGGADRELGDGRPAWHYPSRVECMVCHTRAANYVLGVGTQQLNRAGAGENQLTTMEKLGVFRVEWRDHWNAVDAVRRGFGAAIHQPDLGWGKTFDRINKAAHNRGGHTEALPKLPALMAKLANPYDPSAELDARARSYLHANCAHCHVWAGGGNSAIDLHVNTAVPEMKLLGVPPLHDTFGLANAKLVAPGDPAKSVLLHRLAIRDRGKMPPLASAVVDDAAVKLLGEWVKAMPHQDARPSR
jgi:glucose/arabinose dehydrogenase